MEIIQHIIKSKLLNFLIIIYNAIYDAQCTTAPIYHVGIYASNTGNLLSVHPPNSQFGF